MHESYHVKVPVAKKNGLELQLRAPLNKITQSGMWGDNTIGLSSTGLLRPTDSSSAIRRNIKTPQILFKNQNDSSKFQFQ